MINSITGVGVVFYAIFTYATRQRLISQFNQWVRGSPSGALRIPRAANEDELETLLEREGVDLERAGGGISGKDMAFMGMNFWIIGLILLVGSVPFLISGFGAAIGWLMIAFATISFWAGAKFLSIKLR